MFKIFTLIPKQLFSLHINTFKILSPLLAGLILSAHVFAQPGKGTISGTTQSLTGQALSGISINLEGTTIGTSSNVEGRFTLKNIPEGSYTLIATSIGYATNRQTISINEKLNPEINIQLLETANSLNEVVVSTKVGFTQIEPGRVVYNVKDLPVSNGATAGDILKLMPSMAMGGPPGVPRDVRYRGLEKSYTLVLIDGKNSGLTGNSRETIVNQIPASSVDYIEIISNPGPEYDGDGVNGIVNIVLKKSRQSGTHGALALMADNRKGYNSSLNLAYNKNNLNAFINYDRNQVNFIANKGINEVSEVQKFANGLPNGTTNSIALENKNTPSDNLKAGFGFNLIRNNPLSIEYQQGSIVDEKLKTNDTYNYISDGSFKDRTFRTENKTEDFTYRQLGLNYKHILGSLSNIRFSANYIRSKQPANTIQSDQKLKADGALADNKPVLQNRLQDNNDNNFFSQADFSSLIKPRYLLKAGIKFSGRNRDATSTLDKFDYTKQHFVSSVAGGDNFSYHENVYAAYLSNEFTFGKLSIDPGIRVEFTDLKSKSVLTDTRVNDNYFIPLPSLAANFAFDETQYLKASFGRRIRRANFKDLNPFVDDADPLKIKEGNPALNPELSWSYELGYMKNFKKVYAGSNIFYRDINDIIQKTITDLPAGGVLEKPENFSAAYLGGIEFLTGGTPFKWLNVNANYSRFFSEIKDSKFGGGDALADQFQWSSKLITDFNLPKQLMIQLAYNIIGPKKSAQKTEDVLHFMDIGISKTLIKNGSMMLRVADVFDTNDKIRNEFTAAQTSYRLQRTPGRFASLGFSYNF